MTKIPDVGRYKEHNYEVGPEGNQQEVDELRIRDLLGNSGKFCFVRDRNITNGWYSGKMEYKQGSDILTIGEEHPVGVKVKNLALLLVEAFS